MSKKYFFGNISSIAYCSAKRNGPFDRENGSAFSLRASFIEKNLIVPGSFVVFRGEKRKVCRISPEKYLIFYGFSGKFDPIECEMVRGIDPCSARV